MAKKRLDGFSFAEVVFATETTPKSLRKWLQDEGIFARWAEIFGFSTTGHARFGFYNVVSFSVMRRLVDWGVGVQAASFEAPEIVKLALRGQPWENHAPGLLSMQEIEAETEALHNQIAAAEKAIAAQGGDPEKVSRAIGNELGGWVVAIGRAFAPIVRDIERGDGVFPHALVTTGVKRAKNGSIPISRAPSVALDVESDLIRDGGTSFLLLDLGEIEQRVASRLRKYCAQEQGQ